MAAQTWHELMIDAMRANEAEQYREASTLSGEALAALTADVGEDGARHVSRLLANAVTRSRNFDLRPCPRCGVEYLQWPEGEDMPLRCSISRTSRGDDDAPIPICEPCGQREAFEVAAVKPDDSDRWRTGEGVPPPTEWPVPVEHLLVEDELRYRQLRGAELRRVDPDDLSD